ncbi:tetratricopeptide repeat protein [Dyella psychrodurans]|uniref:tetratricopeptide repeat protein n=1 Tax=Dyella psychrodurans TaxID=1927960 RepID=UPI0011C06107|nr:sel1 repeat family protein [Dyella psychrodurans]
MNALCRGFVCCIAIGLCPCTVGAFDGNQTHLVTDKQVLHALESMSESSTEGHPDLHGQFGGLIRYEKGDYAGAMKYFLVGARYADKVSQMCIGMMYFYGQGVAKDPATAYAWMALSAERNYPKFVATRDDVWAQINPEQREKANEILKQLTTEYGDAVAKPRMIAQLQQAKLHMTGSLAGFDNNVAAVSLAQFSLNLGVSGSTPRNRDISGIGAAGLDAGDPLPRCDLGTVEGGAITGCGDFWAGNRWNSSKYFKATDSFWNATVTVGPLQNASKSSTSKTPATPQPPWVSQPQDGAHL